MYIGARTVHDNSDCFDVLVGMHKALIKPIAVCDTDGSNIQRV